MQTTKEAPRMNPTVQPRAQIDPPPDPVPIRPLPPIRGRLLRSLGLVVLLAVMLGSCTFHSGKQIEVSYTGTRYRFTVYQMPTAAMVGLRLHCRNQRGTARETWSRCSLTYLRNKVSVSSVAKVEWNHFTEGGRWADYAGAIEDVMAGGITKDRSGQYYAKRCIVGDHAAFGNYNWTYRVDADSHCKRGSYAI